MATEEYRDYNARNPTLTETITLRCPSCWQFVYSFEMRSMKDPAVTDLATIRVTVIEGTIREVVAAYGSLYVLTSDERFLLTVISASYREARAGG